MNALVKRYAKGTDSDATDALVVNSLDRQAGGPDDNAAQAGHLVTSFYPTGGSHQGFARTDGVSPPLKVGSGVGAPAGVGIAHAAGVRRLTPTECERLMSWPDGWTAVDGERTPDSRRYAACGDGVVANVAEWIGRRIMAVDAA